MTPYKLIFLDIDGVLNCHGHADFEPSCVEQFNRVLAATEARVVISSAWRYLMLDQPDCPKAMTISGFGTMLRTHKIFGLVIVGHTGPDELFDEDPNPRGRLIRHWLKENRGEPISRYVVVDDEDNGITEHRLPFVRTDGNKGLTVEAADQIIQVLNRGK